MKEIMKVLNEQYVLGKSFRVYGTAENPLFLAKDVAEWIEHTDSQKMIQRIDEDEKLIRTLFGAGQNRDCWFVTENGLYEILMLSRKTIAKEFKKEVKKILHELRRGTVSLVPKTFLEALKLAVNQQEKIEQQNQLLLDQAPKVEFAEAVIGSNDTIDMASVAKILNVGIGRNSIFEILRDKHILDSHNKPYQKYVDCGYFRIIESRYNAPNGEIRINLKTVVFQKGMNYIRKVIKEIRDTDYRNM